MGSAPLNTLTAPGLPSQLLIPAIPSALLNFWLVFGQILLENKAKKVSNCSKFRLLLLFCICASNKMVEFQAELSQGWQDSVKLAEPCRTWPSPCPNCWVVAVWPLCRIRSNLLILAGFGETQWLLQDLAKSLSKLLSYGSLTCLTEFLPCWFD